MGGSRRVGIWRRRRDTSGVPRRRDGFVAQEWPAVFGGEDQMNVNGGKGLWHVRRMASCVGVFQSQRDCGLQPRVARNELPWVVVQQTLQPQPGCGHFVTGDGRGACQNPVGVVIFIGHFPRVARASQPWALGRNPVGILRWGAAERRVGEGVAALGGGGARGVAGRGDESRDCGTAAGPDSAVRFPGAAGTVAACKGRRRVEVLRDASRQLRTFKPE